MESKEEIILNTVRQLQRFAAKYARIEDMPIPVEEGLEVTTREAHAVEAVGLRGHMSVTELAKFFGVTKSAASQTVTRLVDKGFLRKEPSPRSGKEFQLSLTDLGEKVQKAHERFHGADREELLKRLEAFSLGQISTVSVLLEALDDVLDRRLRP
ncbi:transcriptional regulator, MarR family [Humidesulfovibrio mexicanus]|jgi:DNA-binding MarR family transcriptional regulator|uniref:Transcriptional regulator, MarR family n=1 Tax=Humidesulfovibrio mexicanus TaxID=147047 RepID=A0A238Y7E0_9BACT|nr:MarR family transcriptional regulator [Humidesulfovibrio mexicanus]SNR67135.1 transcriptional regulator, MarR family [Humidesulfovibrio mexicanus]